MQKGVDGFFVDNTDVYYNYPQESIYDGILTILDYMDHTGRKIMINGGDCFVKKYLTTEKNVLIDGVNQENVFTAYDFSKDIYTIHPGIRNGSHHPQTGSRLRREAWVHLLHF